MYEIKFTEMYTVREVRDTVFRDPNNNCENWFYSLDPLLSSNP